MKKILIAYVPVLHAGYEKFFFRHADADKLFIFGLDTISSFPHLKKDLRCLSSAGAVSAIAAWGIFPEVGLLESASLQEIRESRVVMPDEVETRTYSEQYFSGVSVEFESVELRYDKKKVESVEEIGAERITDTEAISFMGIAQQIATQSPDWWIQVGGVLVKDGKIILSGHNQHSPTNREALFMGDPRSNYGRGINIELSIAEHVEAALVSEAAKLGVSLLGADLYITTFPCPPCARVVARSGIKRLFFQKGYSMLDGEKLLRSAGVEIFLVDRKSPAI